MAQATRPSLSRATSFAEFKQALLARLQSLRQFAPKNGEPVTCSVYATAGTQAFEAGDSSVYKLRTNLVHNQQGLLAFVQKFLQENAGATDFRALAASYYDMERRFVVQANVWVDNPHLAKILAFGQQDNSVMGLITEEQFTVKDTGELVTTYRLNQVTWNGVNPAQTKALSGLESLFGIESVASIPAAPAAPTPAAPIPPAGPAFWIAPDGNKHAEAVLTASGWTPELLTANGYTKA